MFKIGVIYFRETMGPICNLHEYRIILSNMGLQERAGFCFVGFFCFCFFLEVVDEVFILNID